VDDLTGAGQAEFVVEPVEVGLRRAAVDQAPPLAHPLP
jgi:hypothetical protein